jgi:hypothetical protein
MTTDTKKIERQIRWSGALVAAGLILQTLSMLWTHPLAFLFFLMVGCPLVAAGILSFLYALVREGAS